MLKGNRRNTGVWAMPTGVVLMIKSKGVDSFHFIIRDCFAGNFPVLLGFLLVINKPEMP